MLTRSLKQILWAAIFIQIPSCATIVSDNIYPVTFLSEPSNANVLITDENGEEVHHGITPFTTILVANDGFFDGMDYTPHNLPKSATIILNK